MVKSTRDCLQYFLLGKTVNIERKLRQYKRGKTDDFTIVYFTHLPYVLLKYLCLRYTLGTFEIIACL